MESSSSQRWWAKELELPAKPAGNISADPLASSGTGQVNVVAKTVVPSTEAVWSSQIPSEVNEVLHACGGARGEKRDLRRT